MKLFSQLGNGVRRLGRMVFRRDALRIFTLPSSALNYLRLVGDGTGSSTVAAPINWIARTFPEAPPSLWELLDNGQEEQRQRHAMLEILQRPNPYYTGPNLWMATTTDWVVDGNAYWIKLRNRAGTPVELWWTPSWMIEPKGNEQTFITHYEYTINGQPFEIRAEDVVHFRNGLDRDDPRKGHSPLKSVLREVYTDDEAAAFTASLLKNMGVPGLIVSPEPGVTLEEGDAQSVKDALFAKFSGDKRGEPMVMTGATRVAQFGFSPEQMLLRELRRIPEERVTAVTGIPAIVAGLGAGLDRSTFTNMAEARTAAYEGGMIPMQRILGEDVRFQLLIDFEDDPFAWRFGFDLTKVRVLQEDLYRQAQRWDLMIRGGWAMQIEGRRAMGLEVDVERDSVFLRQSNVTVVDGNDGQVTPMAPSSNGNSANGHLSGAVADEVVRALERRELSASR